MTWDIPQMVTTIGGLLNKFIPDKDARERAANELAMELAKQQGDQIQGQIETNQAEAEHRSVFVAGWRPFIGWVCGAALAWTFVGYPIVSFLLAAFGVPRALPVVPTEALFELVLALLGLGSLRTFEKYKGLTK
jgi:hypothetical protein